MRDALTEPYLFRTPAGRDVRFRTRERTNDWQVAMMVVGLDEYRAGTAPVLDGWALDLGGHIGCFGIPLAVDHPELAVVVIEPVPGNAQLIRDNAELNGVADRVRVLEAAVGRAGEWTLIRYGFVGSEHDEFNAWVGHSSSVYPAAPEQDYEAIAVNCVDLEALARERASLGPPAFVKVDCEGGEWDALEQLVALHAPLVAGEWHPVCGRDRADELRDAFTCAGYEVELTGPEGGPGLFFARLP